MHTSFLYSILRGQEETCCWGNPNKKDAQARRLCIFHITSSILAALYHDRGKELASVLALDQTALALLHN